MTYAEKLKDPRWQKKRLEIFERDKWQCQSCGDKETTLNVHHRRYFPHLDPWECETNNLVTLCENCHRRENEVRPKMEQMILDILRSTCLYKQLGYVAVCLMDSDIMTMLFEKGKLILQKPEGK